jgi:hypothetical protein
MTEQPDLTRCTLRVKRDRRDGQTGTYLGFERRGRVAFPRPDDEAVIGPGQRWISDRSADRRFHVCATTQTGNAFSAKIQS